MQELSKCTHANKRTLRPHEGCDEIGCEAFVCPDCRAAIFLIKPHRHRFSPAKEPDNHPETGEIIQWWGCIHCPKAVAGILGIDPNNYEEECEFGADDAFP